MRKKRLFYARLAASNMRKNVKFYLPYLLACTGTVAMYYILSFLAANDGIADEQTLVTLLHLGVGVIAVFSAILLFYTNRFLMQRRTRELGLYQILGMEKKHIARVLLLETLYTFALSLLCGLGAGILFSKLMLLLLCNLVDFPLQFGFQISPAAFLSACLLFGGIFLCILLRNVRQVRRVQPIELLHQSEVGEREPKVRFGPLLLGLCSLGARYSIAIFTRQPLKAMGLFFVAVLLVILGTYCLFTAGSIALLKALRKNKRYYYTPRHFPTVSGMLHRMRQNAVGLANICILSTMVLVMLSFTTSLFFGLESSLRTQYPRDLEVSGQLDEADYTQYLAFWDDAILQSGIATENSLYYRYASFTLRQREGGFSPSTEQNLDDPQAGLRILPLADYNRIRGEAQTLLPNEALVYSAQGRVFAQGEEISINGISFRVRQALPDFPVDPDSHNTVWADPLYYVVLPDTQAVIDVQRALETDPVQIEDDALHFYYGVDVPDGTERQAALCGFLQELTMDRAGKNTPLLFQCVAYSRANFYSIYGGLFFLGIFLGTLFLMATVLIMYYKQVSEGYEDQQRFRILQKVGMTPAEVKRTISSQVLSVFFLPLAAACLHIAAAFPMLVRLLRVLSLSNVHLLSVCTAITILCFALIYACIYALTARAYYHIVRA